MSKYMMVTIFVLIGCTRPHSDMAKIVCDNTEVYDALTVISRYFDEGKLLRFGLYDGTILSENMDSTSINEITSAIALVRSKGIKRGVSDLGVLRIGIENKLFPEFLFYIQRKDDMIAYDERLLQLGVRQERNFTIVIDSCKEWYLYYYNE